MDPKDDLEDDWEEQWARWDAEEAQMFEQLRLQVLEAAKNPPPKKKTRKRSKSGRAPTLH